MIYYVYIIQSAGSISAISAISSSLLVLMIIPKTGRILVHQKNVIVTGIGSTLMKPGLVLVSHELTKNGLSGFPLFVAGFGLESPTRIHIKHPMSFNGPKYV